MTSKVTLYGVVKLGQRVELIRWSNTPDGWRHETVAGDYLGRSDEQWQLINGSEVTRYDRAEWELCLR